MAKITISGHSDDIVSVGGDLAEEFAHYDEETGYVFISDGTVLSVTYGEDGSFWRINRIHKGKAKYEKVEATNEDEAYSDVVTLTGDIKWVGFGKEMAK